MRRIDKRLELHELLCEILGERNVYFQPPESVKMKYPAIVYELETIYSDFADNIVYRQDYSYSVTVITKDPDSDIPIKISKLPRCRFDRSFSNDNLNHYVFTLYY